MPHCMMLWPIIFKKVVGILICLCHIGFTINPFTEGRPIDPQMMALTSTTFLGGRFTRQQIADVHETVALFPNDSRRA